MAKKKNVFSAEGAAKTIRKRKRSQQSQLDQLDQPVVSAGERRRRKLVEEAGGSYNQ